MRERRSVADFRLTLRLPLEVFLLSRDSGSFAQFRKFSHPPSPKAILTPRRTPPRGYMTNGAPRFDAQVLIYSRALLVVCRQQAGHAPDNKTARAKKRWRISAPTQT